MESDGIARGPERAGRTESSTSRATWLLLVPLLALAIVSFGFVRLNAGEGQQLLARQQRAQALTPVAVARVVRVAPDPVAKRPGRAANCIRYGTGVLGNPWSCTITYSSGRRVRYTVTIRANGSYTGGDELVQFAGRRFHDTGTIRGCCISIP